MQSYKGHGGFKCNKYLKGHGAKKIIIEGKCAIAQDEGTPNGRMPYEENHKKVVPRYHQKCTIMH